MTDKERFEALRHAVQKVNEAGRNCEESQKDIRLCNNIGDLVAVCRKNWYDVINLVPEEITALFTDNFEKNRTALHDARLYFNEDSDRGMLFVCNSQDTIHVSGDCRCYVVGKADVVASGHAQVYCKSPDATITLRGHSFGNISESRVSAYEYSTLNTSTDAFCRGPVKVMINHGTLTTEGHLSIMASGDAVVKTFTPRKITLQGKARIVIV